MKRFLSLFVLFIVTLFAFGCSKGNENEFTEAVSKGLENNYSYELSYSSDSGNGSVTGSGEYMINKDKSYYKYDLSSNYIFKIGEKYYSSISLFGVQTEEITKENYEKNINDSIFKYLAYDDFECNKEGEYILTKEASNSKKLIEVTLRNYYEAYGESFLDGVKDFEFSLIISEKRITEINVSCNCSLNFAGKETSYKLEYKYSFKDYGMTNFDIPQNVIDSIEKGE